MNTENHDEFAALVPPPMDGPSEALVRRLRVLAHETPARAPWYRSPLAAPLSFVGTAAAVVALATLTLTPAKASARTFDMIVAAADRINAFQFSIVSDEGGKHETFSIAGSDGRVTMRVGEGTLMQISEGAMSIYSPEEKKITRLKFGGFEGAKDMMSGVQSGIAQGMKEMDLKKTLREYRAKYGSAGVRVSPIAQEGGHAVYHVALASPEEPQRVEMTVDADSNLPEKLNVQSPDGKGSWRTEVRMEMRYGARVDPSLLRAEFPKGVPVEEIDLSKMVGDAMKDVGKAFEEKPPKP